MNDSSLSVSSRKDGFEGSNTEHGGQLDDCCNIPSEPCLGSKIIVSLYKKLTVKKRTEDQRFECAHH